MLARILWNKWGMLILGIAALAFGLLTMNQTDVTCDGAVMTVDNTCQTLDKDGKVTGEETYEQVKASQEQTSKILTIAGGVLTAGGVAWIVISMLRKKPEEAAAPQAPVAAA